MKKQVHVPIGVFVTISAAFGKVWSKTESFVIISKIDEIIWTWRVAIVESSGSSSSTSGDGSVIITLSAN